MMRLMEIVFLLLSCWSAAVIIMAEPAAEPYYQNFNHLSPTYFRSGGYPYPSMLAPEHQVRNVGSREDVDGRFYIATVTLTLSTVTATSVAVTVTTCTTSTAALLACVPGRRRRDIFLEADNKPGRGLYYDDDSYEPETEEGTAFLPKPKEIIIEHQVEPARVARQMTSVPVVIEPGFNAPEDVRGGRFLMSFATSTVTTTSTSTSTSVLIAICSSTSAFRTCG